MPAARCPTGVPAERQDTAAHPADWKAWQWRVPRTVADVVGARPVDLAVIDAVESMSGGEGFWIDGIAPIEPKLLIVGRNAVCTDAVSAAVMGYDPQAAHTKFPFGGENHLRLLEAAGVGSIDLKRIEVRGLSVEKALCRYRMPPKDGATAAGRSSPSGPGIETYAAACAVRDWPEHPVLLAGDDGELQKEVLHAYPVRNDRRTGSGAVGGRLGDGGR